MRAALMSSDKAVFAYPEDMRRRVLSQSENSGMS